MLGLVAAVGSLAWGCGGHESDSEATSVGDEAGGDTGAGGEGGEPSAPGSGLPRNEPPGLGWSLRDQTPAARWAVPSVVDPVADRLLVFGPDSSEIWSLALSGPNRERWSQLVPINAGPVESLAGGVYDPNGQRFLTLVNGSVGPEVDYRDMQLWELSLTGEPWWRLIASPGRSPGDELFYGILALDAHGNRLFALGGHFGHCGTWVLSLDGEQRWTRLADAPADACDNGPGFAGSGVSLVYDEPRDRLVVVGFVEDWQLPLANPSWLSLGHALLGNGLGTNVHDPAGQRIIRVSYSQTATFSLEDDVWQLGEPLPSQPVFGSAALDSARERIVFFSDLAPAAGNATWQLPLGSLDFETLTPNTRGPTPSDAPVYVFDPIRQAAVTFGGNATQTLTRSLQSGANWERFDGMASHDQGAVYDTIGQTIVGFDGSNLRRLESSSTEWEWDSIASGPARLLNPVSALDENRHRLLIYGGRPLGGIEDQPPLGDLWAVNLEGEPNWAKIKTAGTQPMVRDDRLGVYDAAGDRLIVFGGWLDADADPELLALSLGDRATWTRLEAGGTAPHLHAPSAVYDPEGQRMIVVDVSGAGTNVVALELGDQPSWHHFCSLGTQPGRSVYRAQAMLTSDGLAVAVRDALYRFDLSTPYCD